MRFTNHTISGSGTSRFLRAFDEEYEDEGVRGGDLKRGFLGTRQIPRVVKFDDRPHLDKLIEELTEAFAVRSGVTSRKTINENENSSTMALHCESQGNEDHRDRKEASSNWLKQDWGHLLHLILFRRLALIYDADAC